MGRGKGRKYRKRNGGQGGEKLTPWTTADGKVSEPSLTTMGFDEKEKRIFDLVSMGGKYEQSLNELPLQEIDGEGHSFPGNVSITASDYSRIMTAEATAKPLKSYTTKAAVVGLDSRIYSIGGSCYKGDGSLGDEICTTGCNGDCHAAVFCVEIDDHSESEMEWKQCRPMNKGRRCPLASVVDGKIYVFGGAPPGDYGPFIGEVYDPAKGEWDVLPPLRVPDIVGGSPVILNVVVDDDTNKLILLHTGASKRLYAYDVRKNDWAPAPFDEHFGSAPSNPLYGKCLHSPVYAMSPTKAVVGNLLYCYSSHPGRFFAYHLKQKKWYHVPGILESESDHDRFLKTIDNYQPELFHLGGNTLCFLWSYSRFLPDRGSSDLIIGCAKFKVEFDQRDSSFSVTQQRLTFFDHKVDATFPVRFAPL